MKRIYLFFALVISASMVSAGITTYQFTGVKWTSKVGATPCDGKTDGWTATKDGGAYSAGTVWPLDNKLHGAGVSVQTGQSGVEVTSVKEFTEVRQITFNICQNSGNKGRGVIYVQVGDADMDSIVIRDQQLTESSEVNRDSTLRFAVASSGKICFKVICTKNAIHINTITIRAKEGGTDPFTTDSYQLVTDKSQLQDSDQIIFGAATHNYIMGTYVEGENNVKAIKGYYADERKIVRENDMAVYTLWLMQHKETGDSLYVFVDEMRYEQAFLVSNGGSKNNRLVAWYDYVSPAYGDFGVWDIDIAPNGDATIKNMGTSTSKYMQLNVNNTPAIYSCYASQNLENVCIYRLVKAIGDQPGIAASMCQMGTVVLKDSVVKGSKIIQVNAHKLTQDISCSLKHGDVFSLGATTIDRDGDNLKIDYSASAAGRYLDTLVLTSDTITTEVLVMLTVQPMRTIREAKLVEDFSMVYLNPVVVTKKNNLYTFIRDSTGSMLIFGNTYSQDLKNGDVLENVQGKYKNYYGVPELSPSTQWKVSAFKQEALPDTVTAVDSADVCRYICIKEAVVDNNSRWNNIPVTGEKFQQTVIKEVPTTLDAIVMFEHDEKQSTNELQLWVIKQEILPTGVNDASADSLPATGKYLRGGRMIIIHNGKQYDSLGNNEF